MHGPFKAGLLCPEHLCLCRGRNSCCSRGVLPSLPPPLTWVFIKKRGKQRSASQRLHVCARPCARLFVCTVLYTCPLGSCSAQTWGHREKFPPEGPANSSPPPAPKHTHTREHLSLLGVEPGASFRGARAQKTQLSPQPRPRIRFLDVLSQHLSGIRFKHQHAKMPGRVIPHQGAASRQTH